MNMPMPTSSRDLFQKADILTLFDERRQAGLLPAILFTDIDRCFWEASLSGVTEHLFQQLEAADYGLVLLTGKSRENIEVLSEVPPADIIATAAGTEIFVRCAGELRFDENFEARLRATGWVRSEVKDILADVLTTLQQQGIALEWQPQDKDEPTPQTKEFKISFTMIGTDTDMVAARQAFINATVGLVLASSSHEDSRQYKIDIVPFRSGKRGALEYILENLPQVGAGFVAGNSGNDFAMLQLGAFPAILVGGASAEAVTALEAVQGKQLAPKIFEFASDHGPQKIFVGEGEADKSPRGILRGLADPLLNPHDYRLFKV
jgi:hydroxymethylpyrimidine pyrophosphatase-like HAD family hydrolase